MARFVHSLPIKLLLLSSLIVNSPLSGDLILILKVTRDGCKGERETRPRLILQGHYVLYEENVLYYK